MLGQPERARRCRLSRHGTHLQASGVQQLVGQEGLQLANLQVQACRRGSVVGAAAVGRGSVRNQQLVERLQPVAGVNIVPEHEHNVTCSLPWLSAGAATCSRLAGWRQAPGTHPTTNGMHAPTRLVGPLDGGLHDRALLLHLDHGLPRLRHELGLDSLGALACLHLRLRLGAGGAAGHEAAPLLRMPPRRRMLHCC